METMNVTLRMNRELKESADELFGSLGLSFTTAVNLFVRKALRTRSIPFDVSMDDSGVRALDTTALIESILSSAEAQRRISGVGEGTVPTYHATESIEEAVALINSSTVDKQR